MNSKIAINHFLSTLSGVFKCMTYSRYSWNTTKMNFENTKMYSLQSRFNFFNVANSYSILTVPHFELFKFFKMKYIPVLMVWENRKKAFHFTLFWIALNQLLGSKRSGTCVVLSFKELLYFLWSMNKLLKSLFSSRSKKLDVTTTTRSRSNWRPSQRCFFFSETGKFGTYFAIEILFEVCPRCYKNFNTDSYISCKRDRLVAFISGTVCSYRELVHKKFWHI